MAMNNWGGVTEHMTKKPRKFLSHKKVKRDLRNGLNFQLDKEQINQAEHAKKKSIQKELLIYLVIFIIVILGSILFLKN